MPDDGLDLGIDGLSRFRVIGSGGFSTVYVAWEEGFRRWVAVKVLHSIDHDGRRRFDRERGIMGQLSDHPNVITPFRFGFAANTGSPYLVMDYVPDGSLEDLLEQRGAVPLDEAIAYVAPIADALGYGHGHGVIHRDVKPGNILLARGVAKLTDYGISAIRQATSTQVAYTLAHSPPETFAAGHDLRDERADLYSLASTLYTLVAGHPPFFTSEPDSHMALMVRIADRPVPLLQGEPAAANEFITWAMAKDPANRPRDATEFGAALSAIGSSPAPRPVRPPTDGHRADHAASPVADVGPSLASDPTMVPADPRVPPPSSSVHPDRDSVAWAPPVVRPAEDGGNVVDHRRSAPQSPSTLPRHRRITLMAVGAIALAIVAVVGLLQIVGPDNESPDGATPPGESIDTVAENADLGSEGVAEESSPSGPEADSTEVSAFDTAVPGGRLVYGIEADVASPWAPYGLTCSISCAMPLGAVSDPLFEPDESGSPKPVLASGISANDDASVWTLTLREGITFHDGTPFDAEAVAYNINVCRASSGRGQDYVLIDGIATPNATTVVFVLSEPWAGFVSSALDTPCATHIMSPAWLRTLESNPLRTESSFTGIELIDQETIDTPSTGDQTAPVSMGPFRYRSYTPGQGMLVERNDDYWRGNGPNSLTDEGLPHLDEIEFVILPDVASRSDALRTGSIDILHTANADEIARFQDDDDFHLTESGDFTETNLFLINLADGDLDPTGTNADNPLLDLRVRRALAHAMDRQRIANERGAGIVSVANGPFSPGQPGHLADNGYPEFNPDQARSLLAEYIADPQRSDGKATGEPVEFAFGTTADPFNVETNELVASMWSSAFGSDLEVTVESVDAGDYVSNAVVGNYEVYGWRQHGGYDHDTQLRFWISATVAPIGTPTFNFGRFHDTELDDLAAASRTETDPERRREVFEDINRLFGERVYYFMLNWTRWGIISNSRVENVAAAVLPDGGVVPPLVTGAHPLAQIWCLEGSCQT